MNRLKYIAFLGLAVLVVLFTACSSSDKTTTEETAETEETTDTTPSDTTPTSTPHTVTFTARDQWFQPLAGVSVYVDDDADASALTQGAVTATETTDSDGKVMLTLDDDANDVVFVKDGYASYAEFNRKYSSLDTANAIMPLQVDPLATPPGDGTVTFTLSGGLANDTVVVQCRSISGGYSQNIALDSSGSGSGSFTVPAGTYLLVAYNPYDPAPNSPEDVVFALAEDIQVEEGGTTDVPDVELVGGSKAFTVSATGGLTGGNVSASYNLYNQPGLNQLLYGLGPGSTAGTSLTDVGLFPPSNATYLEGDQVWAIFVSTDNSSNGYNFDRIFRIYNYTSRTDLEAASGTITDTMEQVALSDLAPAHDATGVSTTPTLGLTADTSAFGFTEYLLNQYVLDDSGNLAGTALRGRFRDFANTGSLELPAALALEDDAFYLYSVRARTTSSGLLAWTSKENVCFSTGTAVAPTAKSACGP